MFNLKQKKNYWVVVALAGVAAVGSIFLPSAVGAITLIPPTLELGLIPGQASTTSIKLFNETANSVELFTETRSFSAKGESGQPEFDFNTDPIDLGSWVSVEKGPIVLSAGQRYEVPVTITPPANADPGGHYAAVFFTTSPPADGQVRIASKIGTLILARIAGDVDEAGSIVEFGTDEGQKLFNRLPVSFYARFENTGNVHLKPSGELVIKSMFGQTAVKVDFNASKGATLPDSIRKYELVWEKGSVNSAALNFWSKFWEEYSNEKRNFSIGRYTATLTATAGTDNLVTDSAGFSFWIFPWHMILAWLIIAVVVVFILIMLIKQYNKWVIKKAQAVKEKK